MANEGELKQDYRWAQQTTLRSTMQESGPRHMFRSNSEEIILRFARPTNQVHPYDFSTLAGAILITLAVAAIAGY